MDTGLMQPYTPHGDSNEVAKDETKNKQKMQPYTPHGDSNVFVLAQDAVDILDATLYPSRGQ